MKTEVIVDYLLRVSDGKHQLISRLLELTLQQRESLKAVEEEQIQMLNSLIAQKQEIINRIDVLDQEFLGKFQLLKEKLGITSFADLKEEPIVGVKDLKMKIQQIVDITEKIQVIDEENTTKAKDNLEKVKQQIKTVKIGKKTNHGYGKKFSENTSILIDKKK